MEGVLPAPPPPPPPPEAMAGTTAASPLHFPHAHTAEPPFPPVQVANLVTTAVGAGMLALASRCLPAGSCLGVPCPGGGACLGGAPFAAVLFTLLLYFLALSSPIPGMLALPCAVSRVGILLGGVLFFAVAALTFVSCTIIVR